MDTEEVMRGLYQTSVSGRVCVCVCVCVTKEMSGNPLCFFLKWPNPAQDGKARPCLTAEYLYPFFFLEKSFQSS